MIRRPPRSTLFPTRRSSDLDRPIKRIVRSIDHVRNTHFSDQMPQALLAKDHRVDIELVLEILAWFLLERLAVRTAAPAAQRVGTAAVGRQIAARMSGADLESRESIECSFKDQVR